MILTALVLGFAGSLHCIGMCGPIVLALPEKENASRISYITGRLFYNSGRTLTYILMGLIIGAIGHVISLAGFQASLSIILGIIIIASLFLPLNKTLDFFANNTLWRNTLGKLFRKKSFSALTGIGILNGFLPCGLVYTALAGAAAGGDVLYGGIYMLLFGLGTIPALVALSVIGKQTKINLHGLLKKALPALALILGCLLILRGLSLGIPFVSPDLSKKMGDTEMTTPHHH